MIILLSRGFINQPNPKNMMAGGNKNKKKEPHYQGRGPVDDSAFFGQRARTAHLEGLAPVEIYNPGNGGDSKTVRDAGRTLGIVTSSIDTVVAECKESSSPEDRFRADVRAMIYAGDVTGVVGYVADHSGLTKQPYRDMHYGCLMR
ncbi:MAG: hypothetical protein NT001_02875 [Candidatus Woesearchaeota archaeon]|nr:hypothetical protein [Candidatus Woesearchaeota archaeon]